MTDAINQEKLEAERQEIEALARELESKVREAYAYNPRTKRYTIKLSEDKEPDRDFQAALITAKHSNEDGFPTTSQEHLFRNDNIETLTSSVGKRLNELGFHQFRYLSSGHERVVLSAKHDNSDICRVVIGQKPMHKNSTPAIYSPPFLLPPFHRERFTAQATGIDMPLEVTIAPMLYVLGQDGMEAGRKLGEIMVLGLINFNNCVEENTGLSPNLASIDLNAWNNIALAPLEPAREPYDSWRVVDQKPSITPIFIDEGALGIQLRGKKGSREYVGRKFFHFPEHAKLMASLEGHDYTKNNFHRLAVPHFCWQKPDGTASIFSYFRVPETLLPPETMRNNYLEPREGNPYHRYRGSYTSEARSKGLTEDESTVNADFMTHVCSSWNTVEAERRHEAEINSKYAPKSR